MALLVVAAVCIGKLKSQATPNILGSENNIQLCVQAIIVACLAW